jgi:AhpD family alkylhydroperoxidase
MGRRLQFHEVLPETYKRLLNLHQHVERMAEEHEVSPLLLELVKIRCSQVNGCAFCADLHVGRALEAGEDQRRLTLVATWREAGDLFDERERAALALAEAVCHLPSTQEVPDEVYDEAARLFGDEQLGVVVWAIAEIQTFNALNVTARKPLPPA